MCLIPAHLNVVKTANFACMYFTIILKNWKKKGKTRTAGLGMFASSIYSAIRRGDTGQKLISLCDISQYASFFLKYRYFQICSREREL